MNQVWSPLCEIEIPKALGFIWAEQRVALGLKEQLRVS
jgi:hypothetical protein